MGAINSNVGAFMVNAGGGQYVWNSEERSKTQHDTRKSRIVYLKTRRK